RAEQPQTETIAQSLAGLAVGAASLFRSRWFPVGFHASFQRPFQRPFQRWSASYARTSGSRHASRRWGSAFETSTGLGVSRTVRALHQGGLPHAFPRNGAERIGNRAALVWVWRRLMARSRPSTK